MSIHKCFHDGVRRCICVYACKSVFVNVHVCATYAVCAVICASLHLHVVMHVHFLRFRTWRREHSFCVRLKLSNPSIDNVTESNCLLHLSWTWKGNIPYPRWEERTIAVSMSIQQLLHSCSATKSLNYNYRIPTVLVLTNFCIF